MSPGDLVEAKINTSAAPKIVMFEEAGVECYNWTGGARDPYVGNKWGIIVASTELLGFGPYFWDDQYLEERNKRVQLNYVVFHNAIGWCTSNVLRDVT